MSEFITRHAEDWWTCVCGNEPHIDGFYCYAEGKEVEPTVAGPWDGVHYFCGSCLRVIDQRTGQVVARPKLVQWKEASDG